MIRNIRVCEIDANLLIVVVKGRPTYYSLWPNYWLQHIDRAFSFQFSFQLGPTLKNWRVKSENCPLSFTLWPRIWWYRFSFYVYLRKSSCWKYLLLLKYYSTFFYPDLSMTCHVLLIHKSSDHKRQEPLTILLMTWICNGQTNIGLFIIQQMLKEL